MESAKQKLKTKLINDFIKIGMRFRRDETFAGCKDTVIVARWHGVVKTPLLFHVSACCNKTKTSQQWSEKAGYHT